jgi:hypothetical protein
MFDTFKGLSLEQRQAFIMQYLILGSMAFLLIPDLGIWLMIGSIVIMIVGNQAYIYKTKYTQLQRHQGERYFDTYFVREREFSQDLIFCMKLDAIPLETDCEAVKNLLEGDEYKEKEAIVLKLRAKNRPKPEEKAPEKSPKKDKKEKEKNEPTPTPIPT